MTLKNEELLDNINENFGLEISGLISLNNKYKELKKSWFTFTFSKKQERDFLEIILPKVERLEEEFSKKLVNLLQKEKKDFLKDYKG